MFGRILVLNIFYEVVLRVGLRDTIKKSGLLDTYRKNVFNDFSVVQKAMFYGLKMSDIDPDSFEVISRLPVQINPNNLTEIANSVAKPTESIIAGNKASYATTHRPPPKKRPESKRLSIRLDYDIYDEYNVRTCDGMTGALGGHGHIGGHAIFEEISLTNENLTTLPKLIEYGNTNGIYVLFRWGSIQFFGIIRDVSCTYTAFSSWGDPLKCEAVIDMLEVDTDPNTLKKIVAQCYGGVETFETVINTAAPIANEGVKHKMLLENLVYPFHHANR